MPDDEMDCPGSWFGIEIPYPFFQEALWRNGETGNVLVIEQEQGPTDGDPGYEVLVTEDLLQAPDHRIDGSPFDTLEAARAAAMKYMEGQHDAA